MGAVAIVEARDVEWTPELVQKARADYLQLMRNVPRVKTQRDLSTFGEGLSKWAWNMGMLISGLRRMRGGGTVINVGSPYTDAVWSVLKSWDYKEARPIEQRLKQVDEKTRKLWNDLSRELYAPGYKWEKPPEVQDIDKWHRESSAWRKAVGRRATTFWQQMDYAIRTFKDEVGAHPTTRVPQPEKLQIDGLSIVLNTESGELPFPSGWERAVRLFRKAALSRLPWLWEKRLPIWVMEMGMGGGGHYNSSGGVWARAGHIEVSDRLARNPEELAYTLLHEMGHYLWASQVSGKAAHHWYEAVNSDVTKVNLRDVLAEWPAGAKGPDWAKRVSVTDPIKGIHLELLTGGGRARSAWHGSVFYTREELEAAIAKGEVGSGAFGKRDAIVEMPAHPVTAYGNRSVEEAFAEVCSTWAMRRPVPPEVVRLFQLVTNGKLKESFEPVEEMAWWGEGLALDGPPGAEQQEEHELFCAWAATLDEATTAEGILDRLRAIPAAIRDRVAFITDLAGSLRVRLSDLVALFKDSRVYRLFAAVGWSLKRLHGLIKQGFGAYRALLDAIAEYVANTRVVKWTEKHLRALDAWLSKHPKLKRLGGVAIAGLLVYMWFTMTFIGDVSYDFGMDDVINAAAGNFSLARLFSGKDGIKLLVLFATGHLTGLTFPWPGSANVLFVGGIVQTLAKRIGAKLRPSAAPTEEGLLEMATIDWSKVDLQGRYDHWNRKAFGGSLPKVKLLLNARMKRATGVTKGSLRVLDQGAIPVSRLRAILPVPLDAYKIVDPSITMSTKLAYEEELLDAFLLHEMAHLWLMLNGRPFEGHGTNFMDKIREVGKLAGVTIPRTHELTGQEEFGSSVKPMDVGLLVVEADPKREPDAFFLMFRTQDMPYWKDRLKDGGYSRMFRRTIRLYVVHGTKAHALTSLRRPAGRGLKLERFKGRIAQELDLSKAKLVAEYPSAPLHSPRYAGATESLTEARVLFNDATVERLRKEYLLIMRNVDRVKTEVDLDKLAAGARRWHTQLGELVVGNANRGGDSPFETAFHAAIRGPSARYTYDRFKVDLDYYKKEMWGAHSDLGFYMAQEWNPRASGNEKWGIPGVESRWDYRTKKHEDIRDLNTWEREKAGWKRRAAARASKLWTVMKRAATWLTNRAGGEAVALPLPSEEVVRLEGMTLKVMVPELENVETTWKAGIKKYRIRVQRVWPWAWKHQIPIHVQDIGMDAGGRYHGGGGPNSFIAVSSLTHDPDRLAWVIAHEMGHHKYKVMGADATRAWSAAVRADRTRVNLVKLLHDWPPLTGNLADSHFGYEDWAKQHGKWDLFWQIRIMGGHERWSNRSIGWSNKQELADLIAAGTTTVDLPAHPITAYGEKNPEEAFCEAIAALVSRGPRRVHPEVRSLLKMVLGSEVMIESMTRPKAVVERVLAPTADKAVSTEAHKAEKRIRKRAERVLGKLKTLEVKPRAVAGCQIVAVDKEGTTWTAAGGHLPSVHRQEDWLVAVEDMVDWGDQRAWAGPEGRRPLGLGTKLSSSRGVVPQRTISSREWARRRMRTPLPSLEAEVVPKLGKGLTEARPMTASERNILLALIDYQRMQAHSRGMPASMAEDAYEVATLDGLHDLGLVDYMNWQGETYYRARPESYALVGKKVPKWLARSKSLPSYRGESRRGPTEETVLRQAERATGLKLGWLEGAWVGRGEYVSRTLSVRRPPKFKVVEGLEEATTHLTVFRIGNPTHGLENMNAANLPGALWHLESAKGGVAATLLVYDVTVMEPFGDYEFYRAGNKQGGGPTHGLVGLKEESGGSLYPGAKVRWYSFPAGGPWKAKRIGSVTLSDLARAGGWAEAYTAMGGDVSELTLHSNKWSSGTRQAFFKIGGEVSHLMRLGWKKQLGAVRKALHKPGLAYEGLGRALGDNRPHGSADGPKKKKKKKKGQDVNESAGLAEKKSKRRAKAEKAEKKATEAPAATASQGKPDPTPPAAREPITKAQLGQLERLLDQLFQKVGLDIEFTRHFFDRVNDRRNRVQITTDELGAIFKEVHQRHASAIKGHGKDWEAVITDLNTDINVPFVLNWNAHKGMLELVTKTVMRKRGFKTRGKTMTVNTSGIGERMLTKVRLGLTKRMDIANRMDAGKVKGLRILFPERGGQPGQRMVTVTPAFRGADKKYGTVRAGSKWRVTWFVKHPPSDWTPDGHENFDSVEYALQFVTKKDGEDARELELAESVRDWWFHLAESTAMPLATASLGVARRDMPQIPPDRAPAFLTWLANQGITHSRKQIPAMRIHPTQGEFNYDKIQHFATTKSEPRLHQRQPVLVSSDLYILDGHHRWAEVLAADPGAPINTIVIGARIRRLLVLARAFPQAGERKGIGEAANERRRLEEASKPTIVTQADMRKAILAAKGRGPWQAEALEMALIPQVRRKLTRVYGITIKRLPKGYVVTTKGVPWNHSDPDPSLAWNAIQRKTSSEYQRVIDAFRTFGRATTRKAMDEVISHYGTDLNREGFWVDNADYLALPEAVLGPQRPTALVEIQRFKQATGFRFPGLKAALHKHVGDQNVVMHFTKTAKVGVNTRTEWKSVPAGVYTYPLTKESLNDILTGSRTVLSKYAVNFPFMYLLRAKGRIVRISKSGASNYSTQDYARDKSLLLGKDADALAWARAMEAGAHNDNAVKRLLRLTHYLSARKDYVPDPMDPRWRTTSPGAWTKALLRVGVDAIFDEGSGILDSREPFQAVLLNPRAIEMLDYNQNPRDAFAAVPEITRSLARMLAKQIEGDLTEPSSGVDRVAQFSIARKPTVTDHQFSAKFGFAPFFKLLVYADIHYAGGTRVSVDYSSTSLGYGAKPMVAAGAIESGSLFHVLVDEGGDATVADKLRAKVQQGLPGLLTKIKKELVRIDVKREQAVLALGEARSDRDYTKERLDEPASRRKDRAGRNLARARLMRGGRVRKGDGKHVHHRDGNPQNSGRHNLGVRRSSAHISAHNRSRAEAVVVVNSTPAGVQQVKVPSPQAQVDLVGEAVVTLLFEDATSADACMIEVGGGSWTVRRTGALEVELLGEAGALRAVTQGIKGAAGKVWKFLTKPRLGGGTKRTTTRAPKPAPKLQVPNPPQPKRAPAQAPTKPAAAPKAAKAPGGPGVRGPGKQPRARRGTGPRPQAQQPAAPAAKPARPAPKPVPGLKPTKPASQPQAKPAAPAAKPQAKVSLIRRVGRTVRTVAQAPGRAKAAVTRAAKAVAAAPGRAGAAVARTTKRVVSAPGRAVRRVKGEFKAGLRGESLLMLEGPPGYMNEGGHHAQTICAPPRV